jgi:hypothetical protein
VKFELIGGLIYVPISINYTDQINLHGIIDTGSAGTVVDINKFDINLLAEDAKVITIRGVGGTQEAFVQKVSSVSLGPKTLKDFEIEFCDLYDEFGLDAIIGGDLLLETGAVIDYSKQEISFST